MTEARLLADDLLFPEGPVPLADGSVLLVEIARPSVTVVAPDGTKRIVAEVGGGPNGAAIGPDGKVYVCNNGGCFEWHDVGAPACPGRACPTIRGTAARSSAWTSTPGRSTTLYTECDGQPLRAPNDIVFDDSGGFWFTDHGVRLDANERPHRGLLRPARRLVDHRGRVPRRRAERHRPVARRSTAVRGRDPHRSAVGVGPAGPGVVEGSNPLGPSGGELLCGLPGYQLFDSLGGRR